MSRKCAWHFQPVFNSFGFVFALRNSYLSLLRSYPTARSFAMAPPLRATVPRNKHTARASTLPIFTSAITVSAESRKTTLSRWISVQRRRMLPISLQHCQLLCFLSAFNTASRSVLFFSEGISGNLGLLFSRAVYSDSLQQPCNYDLRDYQLSSPCAWRVTSC